jgi:N-acetylglutamate synthase-like GNAT family acetyltransferase
VTSAAAVRVTRGRDPDAVDRILRALPGWFSVEEAIVEYVADASRLDSYLATVDEETIGVALVDRRFERLAELALLAVDPAWHRRGVGSDLLQRIESDVAADGVSVLQVHTVGPTSHDEGYRQTRAFYTARGFAPLSRRVASWSGPVLLLVKPLG